MRASAKVYTPAKAWLDPQFKKNLLAHPEKTLKDEGIDMGGKKIDILENTLDHVYLTLPPKPEGFSEQDLKNISGGNACADVGCS